MQMSRYTRVVTPPPRSDNRIALLALSAMTVLSMQSVYTKVVGPPIQEALVSIVALTLLYLTPRAIPRAATLWAIMGVLISIFTFTLNGFIESSRINSKSVLVMGLYAVIFPLSMAAFSKPGSIPLFLQQLTRVITLEAAISLALFTLGQCGSIIPRTGTIQAEWGGLRTYSSYFGVFYSDHEGVYGLSTCGRNSGIFAEAPQHAFILTLSLLILLFLTRHPSRLTVIITTVAIISTYSTTGIVVSLIAISLHWAFRPGWTPAAVKAAALLPAAVAIALAVYDQKLSFASRSVEIRDSNLEAAIEKFMSSPLIGVGFKNEAWEGVIFGHTSAVSQILAEGGLLFALVALLPFLLALISSAKNGDREIFLALLCFGLLISVTVVSYTPLYVIISTIFANYFISRSHSGDTYRINGPSFLRRGLS